MSLIRLIYVSRHRSSILPRRTDIDNIVESSQRNNVRNGITGFLIATETSFAQILEGARLDIAETYGRIVKDPRHDEVRIVHETAVELRCFGAWSMALGEQDAETRDLFGRYGITANGDLLRQPPPVLLDLAISLSFRHTATLEHAGE